ncbi:agmatine deiminase family protein [Helicobacter sp. 11S03491-1]|uniref:agmatine deiminase family protein n=1 Tax=Helicobacter sp. 11S03491-1 TaxID=1476196 RepID=UPI000BA4ED5C|nr:agmatine deiminase family protein [Helicobacter sp. 11S03491-1]PAF42290.1 agmatine deiminase [Helicobacter sp. 11S03491-1]
MRRLKAEWEKQQAIMLAFPHKESDWKDYIEEARENFLAIIKQIIKFEKVIVCVDTQDFEGKKILEKYTSSFLEIISLRTNDTWARDFGPISVVENKKIKLLDFGFNGWGLKFSANFDNQISRKLFAKGVLKGEFEMMPIILEGGSIDTDGEGRLLTNTQCLLQANRNPFLSQNQLEEKLKQYLGIKEILWLHFGYLAGDDTDSHIDTLARFLNPHTIAYVKCEDRDDEHYKELHNMEEELLRLRTKEGKAYDLIPLPLPKPIYYENQRLPASYVNFLFINNALLVPLYQDEKDQEVLNILRSVCKNIEVIGIDCSVLIRQHGSLHCVSMQIY